MAAVDETSQPPDTLSDGQSIARVIKATGNNLYSVVLPSDQTILVELPSRFRSTIWMRRGGFVLVDTKALSDRENKIDGEIVNVVRDEKAWRKMGYWPSTFAKRNVYGSDDEDERSVDLPPSQSDED